MTPFEGFPIGGKVVYTAVPDAFFSALLPQIDDLAELKVTLYVIETLYHKKGYPRFVKIEEMLANASLVAGLSFSREKPETVLRKGLKMAAQRGALLSVPVEKGGKTENIYLLNTEADRQAAERIKSGELKVEGLKAGTPAPAAAEEIPNVFKLYEENIGMLTPMNSEELRDIEQQYPPEWIRDAIKEAVSYNKRNLRYIAKILENWSVEGRSDGTHQRDTKETGPGKYFKGKYGHMVQR
jgi:DNA replication protein